MIEDYKDSPIGIIPNDWEVNHLGKICDVRDGTHDSPKYHATGIPFITSKNLTETKLSFEDIKFISKEDHINFSKRSHVENGDILFGMIGTVGKPIVVNEEFEFSIKNVALLKFGNSKELNNFYALNVLKSSIIDNQFKKMSNGGVLNFVALGNIRNLIFPLPPLPEQQKIANILSTVDDKIEVIDQQITETQALKKGLMQRLLTKGIGHTEFKESPLGMIPVSWEVVTINEIAEVKGGKRLPKGEALIEHKTKHPYIRVTDMYMGGVSLEKILYVPENIFPVISKYTISKNDLFISVAGTLGIVGEVPFELDGANLTENANKLTNIKVNKSFLLQLLLSPFVQYLVQKEQTNNAQPKLALTRIKEFIIPKPSIEEQQKIADILNSVDEKNKILLDKKTHYQELKQGLMQQLLTGKIRVKV